MTRLHCHSTLPTLKRSSPFKLDVDLNCWKLTILNFKKKSFPFVFWREPQSKKHVLSDSHKQADSQCLQTHYITYNQTKTTKKPFGMIDEENSYKRKKWAQMSNKALMYCGWDRNGDWKCGKIKSMLDADEKWNKKKPKVRKINSKLKSFQSTLPSTQMGVSAKDEQQIKIWDTERGRQNEVESETL